jgi:hypothetical protein
MVAIRSGDFQLGLMLATALAVSELPTAAEAYSQSSSKWSILPIAPSLVISPF